MSQIVVTSEYLRDGQEPQRSEQFAETPVPVRTGVNSAKSVNLSVTAATANGGFIIPRSGKDLKSLDDSSFTRFNLAAPVGSAGSDDLEYAVGLIQIKADEASVNANRTQIKQEQSALKPKQLKALAQIRLSADAAKNSESAKQLQKILGGVTAGIAVASAVLSVFTFGLASIAGVAAIVSATLAVLGSILSLSGGDEKVMEMFSKWHKSCNSGISDEEAEKFGQQFYAFFGMGVTIAVGLTGSIGGAIGNVVMKGVEAGVKGVSEATKMVCKVSTSVLSFTSSVIESGGGVNAAIKNSIATVQQAEERKAEGEMRQQSFMAEQITNELDNSVVMMFEHWGTFEETLEEVMATKAQLTENIADTPA